ncbi:helix-turn-helix transcriptional regulator [Ruegeria sp. EL01]|uniref:helix-turn-helix transcriptional regulator n=1 Tax=Ruegeria sp. EL01 TaxID=2107578 RepID=UPI0020B11A48|nr:helix-turn-helix transcriptional regulator [Ruegeria sp. EL01]
MIEEGALDVGDVDDLADRLGVSARHLSRLFTKHIGASPLQTAQTLRIGRAKKLLDTTTLPITEVAFQAGFGSVRRFNAAFAQLYGRSPSRIRRGKRTFAEAS